nr:protein IN CHLOROPLAST ATPASE BIOGENESIS, chloroplastic-like isoform X2 [Populus alba]
MKIGGGVFYGAPRASSFLLSLRRHTTLRTFSCSSFPGESIVSPRAKKGLFPLAIPLARNSSDAVIALLRWPTAPPGMEMPVVEVRKHGVWLLAKTVDQYINRILVEEDADISSEGNADLFHAAADAGDNLYKKGDYAKSQILDLDVYLLKKVGLFPDVLERKVMLHLQKGDHVSALVTGEFYTRKKHFPGFARPFAFNAEVMLKIGRKLEAKDAARGALKSPWWTLGCRYKAWAAQIISLYHLLYCVVFSLPFLNLYCRGWSPIQDVAQIAQWEDEQIEYIKEKMTEEGRQEDLNKGKEPSQIALDEAAFLLDLASVEGTWDEAAEQISECYKQAGLHDVARFIQYRD